MPLPQIVTYALFQTIVKLDFWRGLVNTRVLNNFKPNKSLNTSLGENCK